MSIKIIALTGPMGSGKSTACNLLRGLLAERGTVLLKFAEPLYNIQDYVYKTAGIPNTGKDRKLLQWLGTEWGRSVETNLWVNTWKKRYEELRKEHPTVVVLVDDLRFDNEAEVVKVMGGKIVTLATSQDVRAKRIHLSGETHASESGISPQYIDAYLPNNGGSIELAEGLANLLDIWEDVTDEIPQG